MTEQRNPDQIQTDIEQTREELADTAAAESVNKKVRENPIPTAAVSAALLGFALGYISARR